MFQNMPKATIPATNQSKEVISPIIPTDLAESMPRIGTTHSQADPIVHVKLIDPQDDSPIFLTEYNPVSQMGYGWIEPVFGGDGLCCIDVRELQVNAAQRDESWQPQLLSEAIKSLESGPETPDNGV